MTIKSWVLAPLILSGVLSVSPFSSYAAPAPKDPRPALVKKCYSEADECASKAWQIFTKCISKNQMPSKTQAICVQMLFEPIFALSGTVSIEKRSDFFEELHDGDIAKNEKLCNACLETEDEKHDELNLDDPKVSECLIPQNAVAVEDMLADCQEAKFKCLKASNVWELATDKDKKWYEELSDEDKMRLTEMKNFSFSRPRISLHQQ